MWGTLPAMRMGRSRRNFIENCAESVGDEIWFEISLELTLVLVRVSGTWTEGPAKKAGPSVQVVETLFGMGVIETMGEKGGGHSPRFDSVDGADSQSPVQALFRAP